MTESTFNIQDFANSLHDRVLVRGTSILSERGHVRIETGFYYPDGSPVDLYIAKPDLLASVDLIKLTDFGNTLSWLGHLGIDPMRQKRRQKIMEDILGTYDVKLDGAAIETQCHQDDVKSSILRLGQACVRIADLSFMLRFRTPGRFAEDVEEVIAETSLEYDPDAEVKATNGNSVKVDILVRTPRIPTAIMMLPVRGMNQTQLRSKSEHVFTTFYDLNEWEGQRMGITEADVNSYPQSDIDRLVGIGAMITSIANQTDIVQFLRGYDH